MTSTPTRTAPRRARRPIEPVESLDPVDARIEIALIARRENLAVLRDAVESFLGAQLVRRGSDGMLAEVMLAVQEASANVVRHAYAERESAGSMVVRAELTARVVRIVVVDEGKGYDPDAVPPPDFGNPREGGFGLHLLRKTMARVTYNRRGRRNSLVLERPIDGSGEFAA